MTLDTLPALPWRFKAEAHPEYGWAIYSAEGHPLFMSGSTGLAALEAQALVSLVNSYGAMVEALENLVNAPALEEVRSLVAGWNGEGKPDGPYERHPSRLGARIETTCGRIYDLDESLTAARNALALIEEKK